MVMPVRIGSDDRTARFDPLSVIPACAGMTDGKDAFTYVQLADKMKAAIDI